MLQTTRGVSPSPCDPAHQVHLQPRLVAIASRQDLTVSLRVHPQNWSDRGIDLGVHQDDGLAVLEGVEDDMRTELDRSGDVDEHVDVGAARQQERILADDRLALRDEIVELRL